jgi:hypothetical protein
VQFLSRRHLDRILPTLRSEIGDPS